MKDIYCNDVMTKYIPIVCLKKSTEPRPIVFNLHKSKMILQLLCEMLKMFILKAISGANVV